MKYLTWSKTIISNAEKKILSLNYLKIYISKITQSYLINNRDKKICIRFAVEFAISGTLRASIYYSVVQRHIKISVYKVHKKYSVSQRQFPVYIIFCSLFPCKQIFSTGEQQRVLHTSITQSISQTVRKIRGLILYVWNTTQF